MSNSILTLAIKTNYQGIYKKQTKKGQAFIARFTINKKTKVQIIGYEEDGFTDYEAYKERLNLISSFKLALAIEKSKEKQLLFPVLFKRFMQFREPFLAKNTIDNYKSIFNQYINIDFKDKDIRNISSNDLQLYINKILTHKRPATVEKIVSAFKKFYTYLQNNGIYKYNPSSNLFLPKYDNKKYFSITRANVKKIIEYILGLESHVYKTIYLMLLHGRRVNEVLTLKWHDIDFQAGLYHLNYTKTKTRKNQFYHLEDFQIDALKTLRMLNQDSFYVFENPKTKLPLTYTSVFRIHKKLRIDLSMPDFNIHSIRHMIATILVNNGYSLEITARVLGHNSISSTQRYGTIKMDSAQKAYKKTIQSFGITNIDKKLQ